MKLKGNPVVVLKMALKILDKGRHWGKGKFNYKDEKRVTRYCPMGAVFKARQNLGVSESRSWTAECEALTYTIPHARKIRNGIASYNDARKRTWPQVEEWMKNAIRFAEESIETQETFAEREYREDRMIDR